MFHGITDHVTELLIKGIAILLIAFAIDLLKDQIYDSGETYVSILNRFRSKPEVAVALIGFILAGAVISGVAQEALVALLADHRILTSTAGLTLLLVLHQTNNQVEDWNLLDGTWFFYGLALAGLGLLIIPWI